MPKYTNRLHLEEDRSVDFYSTILEIAHDAILAIDQDQKIILFNQGAKRIFGYTGAEIVGQPIDMLLPPAAMENQFLHAEGFVGSANIMPGMEALREVSGRRKDGTFFSAEASIAKTSAGGQAILVVVLRDISERVQLEAEIRERDDRFELLLSQLTDVAWIASPDGGSILDINQAFENIYGRPVDEFISNPNLWVELVHPEDRRIAEASGQELSRTGKSSSEYRIVKPDGEVRWIRDRKVMIKDKDGNPLRMGGIGSDITELKLTIEKHRAGRERLNNIIESANIGTWIWNVQTGETEFNQLWAEIVGYTLDELAPVSIKTWEQLSHPEDLKRSGELLAKHFSGETEIYDCEVRMKHKEGHWVWVRDRGKVVSRTNSGEPVWMYGTHIEITKRKLAERELRQSKKRLEVAEKNVNLGSWELQAVNMEGRMSSQMLRMFGFNPSGSAPSFDAFLERIHPDDRNIIMNALESMTEGQEPPASDFRSNPQFGPVRVFSPTWQCVRDRNGKPIKFMGTVLDITRRKQAELALQESESFIRTVVNSLSAHVVVLDVNGNVVSVNETWMRFARENGADQKTILPLGSNYLSVCAKAVQDGDESAQLAVNGIRAVLDGQKPDFQLEYPCHSPNKQRWFVMSVLPLTGSRGGVVISHENITKRKLAEMRIETQLRRMQSLHTNDMAIANSLELSLTLKVMIGTVVTQLEVDAAAVLLFKPASNKLVVAAGKGFRTDRVPKGSVRLGEGIAGRAALERQMTHIPNLAEVQDESIRTPLHSEEGFIAYFGVPLIAKGEIKGVLEIFHRAALKPDDEWLGYLDMLAAQSAVAIDSAQAFEKLIRSNLDLQLAYDATIEGWSRAMDLRDKETEGHTQRVTQLTMKLAQAMGLSEEEIVHIRRGALLHDMGKLGIPDQILLKPGKLTDEEWVIMRQHPQFAFDMLSSIPYLRPALDIPYSHHEKWDGSGYPRGLKGEQIPMAARLFAVADVWDALTSDRPYRKAWSEEKVKKHIIAQSGTHFDPQVVEMFLALTGDQARSTGSADQE